MVKVLSSTFISHSVFWIAIIVYVNLIGYANGMECYVCKEQEGNVEKCTSTVRYCVGEEDTCQTEVRWGSTPYWSQTAEKQYYVTKTCATKDSCEKTRQAFMPYCHHIWYEDWKCAECCQGDRCNYYAIMGVDSIRANVGLVLISLVTVSLLLLFGNVDLP